MNIFHLHENPVICAKYHHDRHVVKMILECAQMLSTAHRILDRIIDEGSPLYKITHRNHPCSLWTRARYDSYMYVYNLFEALSNEYTYRYNKIHKSYRILKGILKNPPISFSDDEFINPPQCMPEQYQNDDVITAYRNYYCGEKINNAKWTNRETPNFVTEYKFHTIDMYLNMAI